MEPKEDKSKVAKEPSLYADIGGFKGFSFQSNIDSINKLYFGQGLALSEIPYIYKSEKDGKYYLSAYCFKIIDADGKTSGEIYYPETFLNLVFYHDKTIFFVNSNNDLSVYKIDEKSCMKYMFSPQYSKKNEKVESLSNLINKNPVKINEDRLKDISDTLTLMSQNANVKTLYEFLCGIIKSDFQENLMVKSKQLKEKISYVIKHDNMEFSC